MLMTSGILTTTLLCSLNLGGLSNAANIGSDSKLSEIEYADDVVLLSNDLGKLQICWTT